MGFKGGHSLYRKISANAFVPDIETPTLVLTSLDDPITKYKSVPIFDIKRNPNMVCAVLPKGGHIEFPYRTEDEETGKPFTSNYVENIVFDFFERVHDYNSSTKL